MIDSLRRLASLATLIASTVAAVGLPVHGHAVHDDHETLHVEVGHHHHDAAYEQGEVRLIVRGLRVALPVPWIESASPAAVSEVRIQHPAVDRPTGRDPPVPSSPRAPPA